MTGRRFIYLFSTGILWAALLAILPSILSRYGFLASGDTELTRTVAGVVGDALTIGIAALPFAAVIVLSGVKVRQGELLVALLPAFLMNAVYFWSAITVGGDVIATTGLYLVMSVLIPFLIVVLGQRFFGEDHGTGGNS